MSLIYPDFYRAWIRIQMLIIPVRLEALFASTSSGTPVCLPEKSWCSSDSVVEDEIPPTNTLYKTNHRLSKRIHKGS